MCYATFLGRGREMRDHFGVPRSAAAGELGAVFALIICFNQSANANDCSINGSLAQAFLVSPLGI